MIDTSSIPQPYGIEKVFYQDGDTDDIVKVILKTDRKNDTRFCKFAKQFEGKDGLYRLWHFVRNEIKYKMDDWGRQDIKTPAALWDIGEGDCKSKTLFVNQVLRCLGYEYKIRFTSYQNGKVPTHVYTVVCLKNGELPIDTVYNEFGSEKSFHKKWDYPMTKISQISGLDSDVKMKLTELEQKRSAIAPAEYIDFSRLTDGAATALILARQLEIQAGFNPDLKGVYQQGVELIKKQLQKEGSNYRVGNTIAGYVDPALYPIAAMLQKKMGESNSARPALSFGLDYISYVGAEDCTPWASQAARPSSLLNVDPAMAVDVASYFENGKFIYGKDTEFARTQAQIQPMLNALITTYTNSLRGVSFGGTRMVFPSVACKKAFWEELKQRSGIMSQYVNQLFQTTKKGTVGTGAVYSFGQNVVVGGTVQTTKDKWGRDVQTVVGGRAASLSDYPQSVGIKSAMQSNYLNSVSFFSGLSKDNINNLSRNGVLFDNGQQPEQLLRALLYNQNPNIGLDPVTIGAIITGIISLIGAIVGAIQTATKKGYDLDTAAATQARLEPLAEANLFSAQDWGTGTGTGVPGTGAPGTDQQGNSSILPLLLIGGGYLLYNQFKK